MDSDSGLWRDPIAVLPRMSLSCSILKLLIISYKNWLLLEITIA